MGAPGNCFLTIDAIKTCYWTVGNAGSPVVMIHGLTGSIEGFLPVLTGLAAQHWVYALDLPGHGLTDKTTHFSYTLPDFARFVEKFMQAMELQQAHIVGHSMGGAVALILTIQFPQRVDRLVIMDSAGLGREVTLIFSLATLPLLGEILMRPQPPTREGQKPFVFDPAVVSEESMQVDYQHALLPGAKQAILNGIIASGQAHGRGMINALVAWQVLFFIRHATSIEDGYKVVSRGVRWRLARRWG